jgi:fluoroquinolone resistance protein
MKDIKKELSLIGNDGDLFSSIVKRITTEIGSTGIMLADFTLESANIGSISLSSASIENAQFYNCTVKGISFSKAKLSDVIFMGSIVNGSSFHKSTFERVNFSGIVAKNVDFSHSSVVDGKCSSFCRSNLEGSSFSRVSFNSVDFSHSNMNCVNMRGARFENCDFSFADLTGSDFTDASFLSCNFSGACLNRAIKDRSSFYACNLKDCGFAQLSTSHSFRTNLTDLATRIVVMNDWLHIVASADNKTEMEQNIFELARNYANDLLTSEEMDRAQKTPAHRNHEFACYKSVRSSHE